jgi:hypothetical protein
MARLLIQFPTYGRGEKFLNALAKFVRKASKENLLFFNINCDLSDLTMTNAYIQKRIEYIFSNCPNAAYSLNFDASTTKISAINSHIPQQDGWDWDIVIILSDDMVPRVDDWDKEISDAMEKHFPGRDGCVYFDDGSHSAKDLITLSIVGRELYNRLGYLYHPDYKSLYCDNEFTEVVKNLGVSKYIDKKIITHEHWSIEGSENYNQVDIAVQKTLHYSGRDKRVYERRKSIGFPKERITND